MKKQDETVCREFAAAFLRTMDPEAAARAVGAGGMGAALLRRPEVTAEVRRQRETLQEQLGPEDVMRRLVQLAFGPANDCVKLVLGENVDPDALDLSLLSEMKRTDKGVEIKLVSRLEALEKLMELVGGGGDLAADLLKALEEQEP